GGNPFVVTPEENGLIFPKNDAKALSEAILRIKNDPDLYRQLSVGSRESFEQKFTAETMAREMDALYIRLL
ncbi:MAG: glycosyltransferase family 1 protein, partial [Clostridia bacterium]|nr:glycosyltransferase family 1 protein [Clostridia bacterium]